MKTITLLLILVMCTLSVSPCFADAAATVIYVSPTGSDTGSGSYSSPYKTLQKAITASRTFSGNKVIRLRGGRYPVTSTISLGSSDTNLLIENCYGETPELTGGKSIPFSAFTKVTDPAILDRIVETSGKNNVMQVSLPDVGITSYDVMKQIGFSNGSNSGYSPTLTYKDRYMDYARYPNGDYCKTATIIRDGSEGVRVNNLYEVEFTITNQRYTKWKKADDLWAIAFFRHDWADMTVPVKINYDKNTFISYTSGGYYAVPNRRIKFMNLLEEIDISNEFYLDRNTGILYIYPPEGINTTDEFIFNIYNSTIMQLSSCKNVRIQGIKFSNTRQTALQASSCTGLVINACEFTGTGNNAVSVSGSTGAKITNCNVHDVGGAGISVSAGNRNTLTRGDCVIDNCTVERFMRYKKTYAPAITISGVGNTISHCKLSDAPHEAIGFSGNEHTIEYCDFSNVCNDTADSGAIYSGRNWTYRGNQIRYNYFHDMQMIDTTTGMKMQAVYLDDAFSSARVYGNYFYNCSSVALYGGGRNNTFVNNIMIDNREPFVFDARCTTWMDCGPGSQIRNNLTAVPYTGTVWAQAYPELVNILNDDPQFPKYNIITGNVIYNTPDYSFAQEVYQYGTFKDNITLNGTSSFADYKNKDFTVLPNSDIYKKIPDFQTVDFKSIGIKEYSLENQSPSPLAEDVVVSGSSVAGGTLNASYTYDGSGFSEGNTVVQWYSRYGKQGTFTKIIGQNSKSIPTDDSMRGFYLMAEITPVNCEGVAGEKVTSQPVLVHRPDAKSILEVTRAGGKATIKNNDIKPITIATFSPSYTVANGFKTMTALNMGYITIGASEEEEVNDGNILCMDNLEPVD